MRIAILSDNRYPTQVTSTGHGLGRSAARLGSALAARGHQVTIYGKEGTWVEGCQEVCGKGDSDDLADYLLSKPRYDVYIDSTHEFRLMHRVPDLPVVAKICDMEHTAPRNPIYGTSHHAWLHHDPNGIVIPESINVDEVPFNPEPRQPFWLWAALKVPWKRDNWAQAVAQQYNKPLFLIGQGSVTRAWERAFDLPPLSPTKLVEFLGRAEAFLSGVPSMAMLEAAAAGTPSIALVRDEFIAEGITGVVVGEDGLNVGDLNRFDRQTMRDWVAEYRDINKTVLQWETTLTLVAQGRRWGEQEPMSDIQVDVNGVILLIRGAGQQRFWDEGIIRETQEYPIGDGPFHRVLDIGAHIGSFSAWMHHIHPEAQIASVEADPDNYRLLFANIGKFAQALYHARAGYDDRPAWVFHPPDGNTGGNCIVFDKNAFPAERLTDAPPMVTLEALVKEPVDLVKIDIEGGEYDLLSRCQDDTLTKIRRIVGERHGTWENFMERIGNRLSQFFILTDCGHPNGVHDLGTFIAERKS